jgi:hypothetical protein
MKGRKEGEAGVLGIFSKQITSKSLKNLQSSILPRGQGQCLSKALKGKAGHFHKSQVLLFPWVKGAGWEVGLGRLRQ